MKVYRVKVTCIREQIIEVRAENGKQAEQFVIQGSGEWAGREELVKKTYSVLNDWEDKEEPEV